MTKSEERQLYLSIGICPRCKKNPVEPNRHACYECLGYDRDRYYKSRKNGTYKKQAADTERKRIVREKRKSQGLCYRCGKRKADGLCEICKAKAKRYRDKTRCNIERSERSSYGLCYICGKNELYDGHKVCKSCYEKRLETIPAMLASQNNEYFKSLNNLSYVKRGK